MGLTLTATTSFYVDVCCNCGMQFAMPTEFNNIRRNDHKTFYCPSGHPQSYQQESEAEKLRRDRDRLAQRVAERDDDVKRARERADAAERRSAAARGQVTKIKNRVGHGVCPCCNRTFGDLARHMTTKHPTFTAEAAE